MKFAGEAVSYLKKFVSFVVEKIPSVMDRC